MTFCYTSRLKLGGVGKVDFMMPTYFVLKSLNLILFYLSQSLLENEVGVGAAKRRGLSVIRCVVTEQSKLVGKSLEDINFRETYKAAIIAVQKRDKSKVEDLAEVNFVPGDILVIQANDDSPLLVRPPPDFYVKTETNAGYIPKNFFKAVGGLKLSSSLTDLKGLKGKVPEDTGDAISISSNDTRTMEVWRDLLVLFHGKEGNTQEDGGNSSREFLAATEVSKKSEHIGRTVTQAGLDKQSGLFLVSVERPVTARPLQVSFAMGSVTHPPSPHSLRLSDGNGSEMASITQGKMPTATIPVPPEGHLKEGDIMWFAGPATAMADLRKIPGLVSLEDKELKQIDEKVHDRRLVQGENNFCLSYFLEKNQA